MTGAHLFATMCRRYPGLLCAIAALAGCGKPTDTQWSVAEDFVRKQSTRGFIERQRRLPYIEGTYGPREWLTHFFWVYNTPGTVSHEQMRLFGVGPADLIHKPEGVAFMQEFPNPQWSAPQMTVALGPGGKTIVVEGYVAQHTGGIVRVYRNEWPFPRL